MCEPHHRMAHAGPRLPGACSSFQNVIEMFAAFHPESCFASMNGEWLELLNMTRYRAVPDHVVACYASSTGLFYAPSRPQLRRLAMDPFAMSFERLIDREAAKVLGALVLLL